MNASTTLEDVAVVADLWALGGSLYVCTTRGILPIFDATKSVKGREAEREERKKEGRKEGATLTCHGTVLVPNLQRRITTQNCCLEGRGKLLGTQKPLALPLPPPLPIWAKVPASWAKAGVDYL